jgi:hypothetical protein
LKLLRNKVKIQKLGSQQPTGNRTEGAYSHNIQWNSSQLNESPAYSTREIGGQEHSNIKKEQQVQPNTIVRLRIKKEQQVRPNTVVPVSNSVERIKANTQAGVKFHNQIWQPTRRLDRSKKGPEDPQSWYSNIAHQEKKHGKKEGTGRLESRGRCCVTNSGPGVG